MFWLRHSRPGRQISHLCAWCRCRSENAKLVSQAEDASKLLDAYMRDKTDAGEDLKQCIHVLTESKALLAASQRREADLEGQVEQSKLGHKQELDAIHKAQLAKANAYRQERYIFWC
jgi:hypothetical protein